MSIKFALFINSQLAAPALQWLLAQQRVASVIIDQHMSDMHYFTELAQAQGIPTFQVAQDQQQALAAHLSENRINAGLIYGFPYKFSTAVIEQLDQCFLNFHFGLLPEHRGPDPIFWQIKNNKPLGGLCVHHVTEKLDRGDILVRYAIPMQKGETYGSHLVRLFAVSERGTKACIERVDNNQLHSTAEAQNPLEAAYQQKPSTADRRIDWRQSAEQIDAQVRACNPFYLGAVTQLNGLLFMVLESRIIDYNGPEKPPGTVLAIPDELAISCGDGSALALSVVQTDAGFYSGARLKQLGLAPLVGQVMD